MNQKITEKYGFITTISLVVGIVVGSGIFFKADDILIGTGGNIMLGIIAFVFVGIGVLFGALTISVYAHEHKVEGGIVKYSEDAVGRRFAFSVGWFQAVLYFPALIAVLAWVFARFLLITFSVDLTTPSGNTLLWIVTVISYLFAFGTNYLSYRFGGAVQVTTLIIKFVPLIIIAVVGIFGAQFLNTEAPTYYAIFEKGLTNNGISELFITVLAIAFSYDGWIIATSISGEVKNSTKVLPKALVAGTIIITLIYAVYFTGISRLVGVEQIIALGDGHVAVASEYIFKQSAIIPAFVAISVYGGLNGMTLSSFRLFHSLVGNGYMKDRLNIEKIKGTRGLSPVSVILTLPLVLLYLLIHFISTTEGNLLSELAVDLSSMPIIINYLIYAILYIGVSKKIAAQTAPKRVYIYIVIATIVSLVISIGALVTSPILGMIYIISSILIILLGQLFFQQKINN